MMSMTMEILSDVRKEFSQADSLTPRASTAVRDTRKTGANRFSERKPSSPLSPEIQPGTEDSDASPPSTAMRMA